MKIGKKEWRAIVYSTDHYGPSITYEWRSPAWIVNGRTLQIADHWRNMDRWPTYDDNHCNAGCPASLRKLFDKHRNEIDNALAGISVASLEEMLGPEFAELANVS